MEEHSEEKLLAALHSDERDSICSSREQIARQVEKQAVLARNRFGPAIKGKLFTLIKINLHL